MTPRGKVASVVALAALGAGALVVSRAGRPPVGETPQWNAPASTPERALQLFELADEQLEVDLVAAEPGVTAPVAIRFDEDGRLWVVEMPTYMNDIAARGEQAASNRISVLEDKDGDGRFETRTTFLDGLKLPRGVMPYRQKPGHLSALVIEPPEVYFAEDTDGDGRADKRTPVLKGIAGLENPEHAPNGLMLGMDGWIEFSQHTVAFRFDGERVQTRSNPGHGQWGITMDELGRVFYTPNSEALRVDALPKWYASRSRTGGLAGVNELASPDQTVWPSHETPGVNRGYQPDVLRKDRTLRTHTAACGPTIDRSGLMGADYLGNAYVCEPAANLVRRLTLKDENGIPRARNAYEKTEWLRSTDERFRPVNTCMGPDGALYIADMYRGVIQHKTYLTPYLKDQIAQRGLDSPVAMGRIWRVRPRGLKGRRPEALSEAPDSALVRILTVGPEGWWRDTAQRLLIERRPADLRTLLGEAKNHPLSAGRAQVLWTLEATGLLRAEDLRPIRSSAGAPGLAEAVARLCGVIPGAEATAVAMLADPQERVRWQAALALGVARGGDAPAGERHVGELVAAALAHDDRVLRGCVVNALMGVEIEAIGELAKAQPKDLKRAAPLAADLADSLVRGGPPARRSVLMDLLGRADTAGEVRRAVMDRLSGLIGLGRPAGAKKTPIELAREPRAWIELGEADQGLKGRVRAITDWLDWPGRPEVDRGTKPVPLTEEELASVERGRVIFAVTCAACHGAEGRGVPGQTPPLAGSPRATGPLPRVARIVLHGMDGSFERDGAVYNGQMPAAVSLKDRELADVLTFVRRSWGNSAAPISGSQILGVRIKTAGRSRPWNVGEIDSIPEE